MGLFDRWRKRADAPAASPADDEHVVVPEGHQVDIHRASPLPGFARSAAGVWLAHVGGSSDELEEDLDRVLGEVEMLLSGPRPQIFLAADHGLLSSLMAPADPALTPISGHLVWTLDAAALAGAPRASALVQRLLRRIYVTSRAAITQSVFALSNDAAPARAVVTLIRELGIGVRAPEPKKQAVLVEVHRPEGVILSALPGTPYEEAHAAGAWAREVNVEKDLAAGDRERRARLEEEERRVLEERLAPAGGARRVAAVDRAPRLRRLLLAVGGEGGAAVKTALYDELLGREIPLLFMIDPRTRGIHLRAWPGGFEALAVYADNASLLTSARDLGLPMSSFAIAEMEPAALFSWGAGQGWAVAICVFAESGKPVYVPIHAEEVRALAAGRPGAV
ncbi:hypothetical protein [Sorangium sp. So ce128]|uniref:hypothetical protein n=1 Tax=Sorangium sp. So ce128 TaxID=3133281 RepID=UPI003F63C091